MSTERYPVETLDAGWEDDGTMPANVAALAEQVVGHRIKSAAREMVPTRGYYNNREESAFVLTLDDGRRVILRNESDCCAYTDLESFLLHADRIDHVITGVGTTNSYATWHIYADMGDVLEMSVQWSSGNPFYYAYGFTIEVEPNE